MCEVDEFLRTELQHLDHVHAQARDTGKGLFAAMQDLQEVQVKPLAGRRPNQPFWIAALTCPRPIQANTN